jgi:uncharacterized membrane protein YhaH (DUF805 family)
MVWPRQTAKGATFVLGQIYSFDHDTGGGFILGQDGYRYSLVSEDFRFPTNPVVGMIVQYSAEENIARDVVTLDRLPIQGQGQDQSEGKAQSVVPAWGKARKTPIRAGGTDGDPGFRQAAQQEMERWRPPLPVPPAAGDLGRAASLDPSPPPPPPPSGSFDLWGNFKYCMTTGYSLFRGRARRRSLWGFVAVQWLIIFGLMFVGIALDTNATLNGEGGTLTIVLPGLFALATTIPTWAVFVRRLHDIGLTGWLALAVFIPGLGFLALMGFSLFPGSARDNRYGPAQE